MTKSKHTPGPWRIQRDGDFLEVIGDPHPEIDEYTTLFIAKHADAQEEANAHLIAAAPELLEALESIANDIHMRPMVWLETAKAAISAARGD